MAECCIAPFLALLPLNFGSSTLACSCLRRHRHPTYNSSIRPTFIMLPASKCCRLMATAVTSSELSLRLATEEDLDDITQVALEGLADDPELDYWFPRRHDFPADYWKWQRQEFKEYLEQPEKYAVVCVTAPAAPDRKTSGQAVSFAVWDMSFPNRPRGGGELASTNASAFYLRSNRPWHRYSPRRE